MKHVVVIPGSRATCDRGLPDSLTRHTASDLYSSLYCFLVFFSDTSILQFRIFHLLRASTKSGEEQLVLSRLGSQPSDQPCRSPFRGTVSRGKLRPISSCAEERVC